MYLNNKVKFILLIVVISLFINRFVLSEKEINNCTIINEPGNYFINVNELSVSSKDKICLLINTSNVFIDGRFNEINGFDEYGAKAILINGNETNILKNITITNIIINKGYSGIKVKYSKNIKIKYVFIKNTLEGILLDHCSNISIEKSKIKSEQRSIVSDDNIKVIIKNNNLNSLYSYTIDLNKNYYASIINNIFEFSGGSGIRTQNSYWINIEKNTIKNSSQGVEIKNSYEIKINNNYFNNVTQKSVDLEKVRSVETNRNLINSTQTAFFIKNAKECSINKSIINNANIGFIIENCSSVKIKVKDISNISYRLFWIKNSSKITIDYSNVSKSESLIEFSEINVRIKKDNIKENKIYKQNASIIFEVVNKSNIIKSTDLSFIINEKKDVKINVSQEDEEKSIFEKISVKQVIIFIIIIIIITLIYEELKLLNNKNKTKRRRKRKRF